MKPDVKTKIFPSHLKKRAEKSGTTINFLENHLKICEERCETFKGNKFALRMLDKSYEIVEEK